MKTTLRNIFIAALFATTSLVNAQEVNTLYFLENAPMRHIINPAFQPVSGFYLALPMIGHANLCVGNNAFTMQDFIYNDPTTGQTITAWHPNANPDWLKNKPNNILFNANAHINLLSLGARAGKNGYFHLNISEHIQANLGVEKQLFKINDISTGTIGPLSSKLGAMMYTEFAVGYSHKINEQWSVGAKLKALLGHVHMQAGANNLTLETGYEEVHATGTSDITMSAPLHWQYLPENINGLESIPFDKLIGNDYRTWITPTGLGSAIDLGVSYKPIEQLQITAAVTDLGLIHWNKATTATVNLDASYTGVELNYGDLITSEGFQSEYIADEIAYALSNISNAIQIGNVFKGQKYNTMLTTNLNVGIDANFWENRVGVGVYSRTRFAPTGISEEVTLGAALRPVNWFNMAASYSFINGYWSNIGAALSIAPYDGIMLTLATDYVPLTYANAVTESKNYAIPYKTPGTNISLGIAIVAGTNKKKSKDQDRDGIKDRFDLCPNTPENVLVDETGCPLDSDGDGVADYMDECPDTPEAAYELIDSVGCPLDSDNDSIPDYMDQCLDTPAEAIGYTDEKGCLLDTDGDGVEDYIDKCTGTPVEAYGFINESGCPVDTDGDGVEDYLDRCGGTPAAAYDHIDEYGCPIDTDGDGVEDYIDVCPNTPQEAHGTVDHYGCPLDSDRDGVYDYMDECPNTIVQGRNHVDSVGCLLDTDNDGVYDYEDLCPTIAGVKANKGCPEVKREVRNLLNKAMNGIQFEHGKATIKPVSYPILNDIAKIFIENTAYYIEVQGHTDNTGNYEYNMELSEKRAQAVRTYLISKGVPAIRLTAHGYGPDKPIADNLTKDGRYKNRRVEFNITFEEVTYETVYDRVEQ